ncbi:hypothetical protein AEQ67_12705 [Pseudomonas sp. RIT-PI-q]|nr:hypothetical protein AEQ67_12705 [Pseudomonas sp. RIT-PI-q]
MNNAVFYIGFTFCSCLFYFPSLWASYKFSGRNFTVFRFWGVMTYNVVLIFVHVRFIKEGYVPVIGEQDNSGIGWLSFFFVFAYAYAIPFPWKSKCWSSRRKI